jgi:hypothetical protein
MAQRLAAEPNPANRCRDREELASEAATLLSKF